MDSKPAGQPEQPSLNQCQLIAANRPKLVLCASPADGGDKVSLYCTRYDSHAWSLFPRDLALMPYLVLLASVQLFTTGHIVIGLLLHVHSFLHQSLNHALQTVFPLILCAKGSCFLSKLGKLLRSTVSQFIYLLSFTTFKY